MIPACYADTGVYIQAGNPVLGVTTKQPRNQGVVSTIFPKNNYGIQMCETHLAYS